MSALFINDLDAGAGHLGQRDANTVNNQMVNATLMNLADNPTNVQLPASTRLRRFPSAHHRHGKFLTLYAPLIRGRMEVLLGPTFKDRVGVACGIFKRTASANGSR